MYLIARTKDFEKSYKRIKESGKFKPQIKAILSTVIDMLAQGKKLSPEHKDHQLRGELKRYRECHVRGDLLLVYQVREQELLLVLVDIGTHSYLGL